MKCMMKRKNLLSKEKKINNKVSCFKPMGFKLSYALRCLLKQLKILKMICFKINTQCMTT